MSGFRPQERAVPLDLPVALSKPWTSSQARALPRSSGATTPSPVPGDTSTRVGRRQLTAIGESLSERDWAVLRSVDAHRFLSTRLVEGFHFHDHATPLTGARVARRVLRRLADQRVLAPLRRRIGGLRAGSVSTIWRVGPVGDRLLRTDEQRPRRRQREPGLSFLQHHLAVAEVHLSLVRAHRAGALELLDVQLEPACWRRFTGVGGARLVLQPDLLVTVVDPVDDQYQDSLFVEIDRGSEHPARLLAKCAHYEAYRASGAEQADGNSFPLVVWAMRDEAHVQRLREALERSPRLDQDLYRITTHEQLTGLITGGAV